MTDSEKLDLLLSELGIMKNDMSNMKNDMSNMKNEIGTIKTKLNNIDTDVTDIKSRLNTLETNVRKTNLHLENDTDKNLQLIAENFVELTKKLNQAIPAANNNLMYEVKVNHAISEINKLRDDFEEFKIEIHKYITA